MEKAAALKVALQLLHMPANVRLVRAKPLPEGILQVLQLAARDTDALAEAAAGAARDPETMVRAARFFAEQILLCPGADSFRVLGGTPRSSSAELKRNMALLMNWLHPDAGNDNAHAAYAKRITTAWNDVKTEEKRRAYTQALAANLARENDRHRKHRARVTARSLNGSTRDASRNPSLLRYVLTLILGPRKA